jgi:hypothetical protein
MIPNNLVQPVWNQKQLPAGTHYVYVPNDFADYDEVWAHLMVHGTNGAPTSGNIIVKWQISHPQASGGYHDQNPIWNDLNYKQNSHLFHSGLDWPYKVVRTVPATFSPEVEFIRGLRLGTGRVRLKVTVNFAGGTSPSYTVSLALYARRSTADIKPTPQPKYLSSLNTLYDYVRDVWGYTIRNKDSGLAKIMMKNGSTSGTLLISEHLAGDASITRMFERPIRFESGLYPEVTLGGSNGIDITVYTTDNIDT